MAFLSGFQGKELPQDKFEMTQVVLSQVPHELLTENWTHFYTTGNKNEHNLVLEIVTDFFTQNISINSYETQTERLAKNVQIF